MLIPNQKFTTNFSFQIRTHKKRRRSSCKFRNDCEIRGQNDRANNEKLFCLTNWPFKMLYDGFVWGWRREKDYWWPVKWTRRDHIWTSRENPERSKKSHRNYMFQPLSLAFILATCGSSSMPKNCEPFFSLSTSLLALFSPCTFGHKFIEPITEFFFFASQNKRSVRGYSKGAPFADFLSSFYGKTGNYWDCSQASGANDRSMQITCRCSDRPKVTATADRVECLECLTPSSERIQS